MPVRAIGIHFLFGAPPPLLSNDCPATFVSGTIATAPVRSGHTATIILYRLYLWCKFAADSLRPLNLSRIRRASTLTNISSRASTITPLQPMLMQHSPYPSLHAHRSFSLGLFGLSMRSFSPYHTFSASFPRSVNPPSFFGPFSWSYQHTGLLSPSGRLAKPGLPSPLFGGFCRPFRTHAVPPHSPPSLHLLSPVCLVATHNNRLRPCVARGLLRAALQHAFCALVSLSPTSSI